MMRTAVSIAHRARAISFASMLPALLVVFVIAATPFAVRATGTDPAPAATDDALRAGAEVYSLNCSACHQPGGAGLASQFPPLLGNPNVDDAAYIETVIRGGLTGEIMVNDQTFDSTMPAQSTLDDADIAAVIAYIQSGFAGPAVQTPEIVPGTGSDSGTSDAVRLGILFGLLVAVLVASFRIGPQVVAAHDRREITWPVAWGKTAVIVVGLILTTTFIPSWVLESGTVQDLSRNQRDLITVGVWSGGLAVSLFALWYAHRKRRI